MTVWFHLLTSPLVITSCQIGFLYSALATSSGSDLKKKKKLNKTKNKKQNKRKTKNKTVHQIVNDSSIVPSFGQGHVHVYRFTIDDIYILTGRSERETIACSLYKCRILSDSFFNFRCLTSYVMPSKSRPSCSRTKTNSEIFHIRLEQISPVFIIVISVNVAVALQPEH